MADENFCEETDWYSVTVGLGKEPKKCKTLAKKWIEAKKSENVGELWTSTKDDLKLEAYELTKAFTLCNDNDKSAFEAPQKMPLENLRNAIEIVFLVNKYDEEETANLPNRPKKNAFAVLMDRSTCHLPHTEVKTRKDQLFNDVVEISREYDFKCSKEDMDDAKKLLHCVTDCLWSIDTNHAQINSASCNKKCKGLPAAFKTIYDIEYHDWRGQKKAKPRLSAEAITRSSNELFDMLSLWNNVKGTPDEFMKVGLQLAECLQSYSKYLQNSTDRMERNRSSTVAPRNAETSFTMPAPFEKVSKVNPRYFRLNGIINHTDYFQPIVADNDYADFGIPDDRKLRYVWFKDLKLSCRVQLYQYNAGGRIGNISFLWKIPDGELDQKSQNMTVRKVSKMIPEYETRKFARELRDRYSEVPGFSPAVRRNFVQFLTGKLPESKTETDDLYEQYISMPAVGREAAEIIYDKRKENSGRPEGDFSKFYRELNKMLEEYGKAAEERRKSVATHLPFAVSVPSLIRKVKERMIENGGIHSAIPSETTVRYQFLPPSRQSDNAFRYTGRFDVVSKIQRRQIRKFHEDAHYVNAYFLNIKSWCAMHKSKCQLVFMDDKAKIPVGEPGTPEASTSHNRRALTLHGIEMEASDHNYHTVSMTPSVSLLCDVPDSPNESFYGGQIFVGIKDSVFNGSDPLRHVVELLTILRTELEKLPPFLVIFSDGGADHNITFLFVQCVLVALFKICDFDILNVGRCAPHQSYINPAERCMSLLNIGLQGLALERDHAGVFESGIRACGSMKTLRESGAKFPGFKDAFLSSIEAPRKQLYEVFRSLQLKGKNVKVYEAARDPAEVVQALNKIEPNICQEEDIPHSMSKLKNYPSLKQYLERHMVEGLYLLQFRKCNDKDCCLLQSDALPPPIPAPVLQPDGCHYMSFADTYGIFSTSEKDCPSLNKREGSKKAGANFKFLASRVVASIDCCQCGKPRCVYSHNGSLSLEAQRELEEILFSCGSFLVTKTIYTASHIKCSSTVEHSYYAARFTHKHICVHCGSKEIMLQSFKEKCQSFKTVFPTCEWCKTKGLEEICVEKSARSGKGKVSKVQQLVQSTISANSVPARRETAEEPEQGPADDTTEASFKLLSSQCERVENIQRKVALKHTQSRISFSMAKKPKFHNEDGGAESSSDSGEESEDNDPCSICKKDNDASNSAKIAWVDCDVCHKWAHLFCAKKSWRNIRRRNWLCIEHKD